MWEGGSRWGTHVNPWLIHVDVWQKPLQYCKIISLQLIKINEKKCGPSLTIDVSMLYLNEMIDFFYKWAVLTEVITSAPGVIRPLPNIIIKKNCVLKSGLSNLY